MKLTVWQKSTPMLEVYNPVGGGEGIRMISYSLRRWMKTEETKKKENLINVFPCV